MFPSAYVLPQPERHQKDVFWVTMVLRRFYRIIGKGELPEAQGITIITETPVSAEHQETLGLKPLEEVLDPA